MNNDLISRNIAISYAISGLVRRIDEEDWIRVSEVKQNINDAPTVPLPDFKEGYKQAIIDGKTNFSRPKGEWLHPYKSDIACECSNCHIQMPITDYFNFCPNCGTEMKGGAE